MTTIRGALYLHRHTASSHQLTRFHGCERGQEGDGIHDALLTLESTWFQDPCCCWVNNEDVKEKAGKTRQIVAGAFVLVAHGDGVLRAYNTESIVDW